MEEQMHMRLFNYEMVEKVESIQRSIEFDDITDFMEQATECLPKETFIYNSSSFSFESGLFAIQLFDKKLDSGSYPFHSLTVKKAKKSKILRYDLTLQQQLHIMQKLFAYQFLWLTEHVHPLQSVCNCIYLYDIPTLHSFPILKVFSHLLIHVCVTIDTMVVKLNITDVSILVGFNPWYKEHFDVLMEVHQIKQQVAQVIERLEASVEGVTGEDAHAPDDSPSPSLDTCVVMPLVYHLQFQLNFLLFLEHLVRLVNNQVDCYALHQSCEVLSDLVERMLQYIRIMVKIPNATEAETFIEEAFNTGILFHEMYTPSSTLPVKSDAMKLEDWIEVLGDVLYVLEAIPKSMLSFVSLTSYVCNLHHRLLHKKSSSLLRCISMSVLSAFIVGTQKCLIEATRINGLFEAMPFKSISTMICDEFSSYGVPSIVFDMAHASVDLLKQFEIALALNSVAMDTRAEKTLDVVTSQTNKVATESQVIPKLRQSVSMRYTNGFVKEPLRSFATDTYHCVKSWVDSSAAVTEMNSEVRHLFEAALVESGLSNLQKLNEHEKRECLDSFIDRVCEKMHLNMFCYPFCSASVKNEEKHQILKVPSIPLEVQSPKELSESATHTGLESLEASNVLSEGSGYQRAFSSLKDTISTDNAFFSPEETNGFEDSKMYKLQLKVALFIQNAAKVFTKLLKSCHETPYSIYKEINTLWFSLNKLYQDAERLDFYLQYTYGDYLLLKTPFSLCLLKWSLMMEELHIRLGFISHLYDFCELSFVYHNLAQLSMRSIQFYAIRYNIQKALAKSCELSENDSSNVLQRYREGEATTTLVYSILPIFVNMLYSLILSSILCSQRNGPSSNGSQIRLHAHRFYKRFSKFSKAIIAPFRLSFDCYMRFVTHLLDKPLDLKGLKKHVTTCLNITDYLLNHFLFVNESIQYQELEAAKTITPSLLHALSFNVKIREEMSFLRHPFYIYICTEP